MGKKNQLGLAIITLVPIVALMGCGNYYREHSQRGRRDVKALLSRPELKISYSDITPLFEKHCDGCHFYHEAPDELRSSVAPFSPEKSELIKRLRLSEDDDEFMPMGESPLSKIEIEVLEKWILQGANYD